MPSPAPSPSASRSSTPPPGPGPDLAAAVERLEQAGSYRYVTQIRQGRTEDRYEATVVSGPPSASSGRLDTTTGAVRVIVIGDQAWISRAAGPFASTTVADADAVRGPFGIDIVAAPYLRPALARVLTLVGAEPRNGVSASRYAADADALATVMEAPAGTSLDVWLDAGGRLVALEAIGLDGADHTVLVDVEGIDDPANRVERPG